MSTQIWDRCSDQLHQELPEQQFNTWIKPLRPQEGNGELRLLAPNRFVLDWVSEKFLPRIRSLAEESASQPLRVIVDLQDAEPLNGASSDSVLSFGGAVGRPFQHQPDADATGYDQDDHQVEPERRREEKPMASSASNGSAGNGVMASRHNGSSDFVNPVDSGRAGENDEIDARVIKSGRTNLDSNFTFQTFVEGKSNQLALAAARQVADNPGEAYNPLFIYGGVGLGKTHLMQAVGNELRVRNPGARVLYLHSERFVADMVKALQLGAINEFKRYYRSVDALLIDDIQFFANKDRSQEEFFHTFNSLLESHQQVILSCDRYPKEIDGLEERLKSRFGWGLTVAVEPPELETRVAILKNKAAKAKIDLPNDGAFFIAQRIRSNVRELEGALKRVIASAHFTGRPINMDLIKESLKDLLALQDRLVTIDNIQRTVAEYYQIKLSDLMSKKRTRSLARPRQVAMALAKSLTNNSLPEIGTAFGGRDHTTVLHACRKIRELEESSADMREDLKNLNRILTH